MNPNIKLLSPNIKKENLIVSNQHSTFNINNHKFNSSLNNKISTIKNINNNNDQTTANGITNKSIINGKFNIFKLNRII